MLVASNVMRLVRCAAAAPPAGTTPPPVTSAAVASMRTVMGSLMRDSGLEKSARQKESVGAVSSNVSPWLLPVAMSLQAGAHHLRRRSAVTASMETAMDVLTRRSLRSLASTVPLGVRGSAAALEDAALASMDATVPVRGHSCPHQLIKAATESMMTVTGKSMKTISRCAVARELAEQARALQGAREASNAHVSLRSRSMRIRTVMGSMATVMG